jgi:hypothetical protein
MPEVNMKNAIIKSAIFIGLLLSTISCLELDCCAPPVQRAQLFRGSQNLSGSSISLKVGEVANLTLKVSTRGNFLDENPIVYLYTARSCKTIQDIGELQTLQSLPEISIKLAGNTVNPSDKFLPNQTTFRTGELSFSVTGLSSTTTPYFGDDCLAFVVGFTNPQQTPNIEQLQQGFIGIEVI